MDGIVRVARAGADDWQAVRDIRSAALLDAPFAFGSTLERELAFGDHECGTSMPESGRRGRA